MKTIIRSFFAAAPKGDATFLSRVTRGLTTAALALAAVFVTSSAWAEQMYVNKLATLTEAVSADEYGSITVPGYGYKATAYATQTQIGDSNSALKGTQGGSWRIATHTISGWFKVAELPAAGTAVVSSKPIFVSISYAGVSGGYKLGVTADGYLNFGRIDGNSNVYDSYVTTDGKIGAGEWHYLTVAVDAPGTNNNPTTPTIFVDGVRANITSQSTSFTGGLNGGSFKHFDICAGISAAGLYADTTAVTDETAIKGWATSEYFVEPLPVALPTISLGFDGGKTASKVLGGAAPATIKDWGSPTYDTVRGSDTDKAYNKTSTNNRPGYSLSEFNGSGDWTINFVAKLSSRSSGAAALFGIGGTTYQANQKGIAVGQNADNTICVKWYGFNGERTKGDIFVTSAIAGATVVYHTYTLTHDATSNTYALYVDGILAGSAVDSTHTGIGNYWCLGNIYGGGNEIGLAYTDSNVYLDDFALWSGKCLTVDEVKKVANLFPMWPTFEVTLSGEQTWTALWEGKTEPVDGLSPTITVSGNSTLTLDKDLTCGTIKLVGEGNISIDADSYTCPAIDATGLTGTVTITTANNVAVNAGANALTYNYNGIDKITPEVSTTSTFTKGGTGPMALNASFNPASPLTVARGVLEMANNSAYGNDKTVKVLAGGQLKGKAKRWKYELAGDGPDGTGALFITACDSYGSANASSEMTLTANATLNVNSGVNYYFVNGGNAANAVNLGEFTLTKIGAGGFYFSNTTLNGTGVLEIKAGTVGRNSTGGQTWKGFTDATVLVDGGTLSLSDKLSPKNFTYTSGTISDSSTLTVTGVLTLGDGATLPAVTLTGSEINVAEGAAAISTLTCANGFTKTGAGTLNLPIGYTGAVALQAGMINDTFSGSLTIAGDITCAANNLPLLATLAESGHTGSITLPKGYFGQIAKITGDGKPIDLTIKDLTGTGIDAGKFTKDASGFLVLKVDEITTVAEITHPTEFIGDMNFGAGGGVKAKFATPNTPMYYTTGAITVADGTTATITLDLYGQYEKGTKFIMLKGKTLPDDVKKFDCKLGVTPTDTEITATIEDTSDGQKALVFTIAASLLSSQSEATKVALKKAVADFDAGRLETLTKNDVGNISKWVNLNSTEGLYDATPAGNGRTANQKPTFAIVDGRPVVDFGECNSQKDLGFTRVAIKTAIQVIQLKNDKRAFYLGDYGPNGQGKYSFHRDQSNSNPPLFNTQNAKVFAVYDNSVDRGRGTSGIFPETMRVISVATDSNECYTDCFTMDRNNGDQRSGGRKLCETLLFTDKLTDAERVAIEDYLGKKWGIYEKLNYSDSVNVSKLNEDVAAVKGTAILSIADGVTVVVDAAPSQAMNFSASGTITVEKGDAYAATDADFANLTFAGATKTVYRNTTYVPSSAPAAGITYRWEGTTALATIPFAGSAVAGTIEIACPVANVDGTDENAAMSGAKTSVVFDQEFTLTSAEKLSLGSGDGANQSYIQKGGTLELTNAAIAGSCGDTPLLLARFGVTVNYDLKSGSLLAENGTVQNWDGTFHFTIGDSEGTESALFKAKGFSINRGGQSYFEVLKNGTLAIGANGVTAGANQTFKLNGGTLQAYDTFSSNFGGGIQVLANSSIQVDQGKTLTISSPLTGSGNITKTGAGTLKLTGSLANYMGTITSSEGIVDFTGQQLPVSTTIVSGKFKVNLTNASGYQKIANVPTSTTTTEGFTLYGSDDQELTSTCISDNALWYGEFYEGTTYTLTDDEASAIKALGQGGLYSKTIKQIKVTELTNVPEGYFSWFEGSVAYVAQKSNSISVKLGTRTTDRDSRILTTDTSVGGFPVAGKFWNVAKVSNGNAGNPVSDYTTLLDGNGVASTAHIAYYAVNTYFAANSPTPFATGNERLLGTYLDDGDVAKDTTWTINASSDGTAVPDGDVTLPATPNNRGWEVQISNIPYDMYDLYVYIATDQPEDGLKACPVTISVDNGATWSYYAGEAKCTDADSWSPLAYSHVGVVTEGKNYIRFRVSKNSMGVENISTILLSHGTRNTDAKKRLGLAGIQIVEIDDDGVRDRKAIDGNVQNWHDAGSWVQTKKDATTVDHDWVDSTSSSPITARINANKISTITMDSAATVDKLVITGAADTFTIDGEGKLTTKTIDATGFAGNIVFDAPVSGALSLGENAKVVVEIEAGEEVNVDNILPTGLTIASGSVTLIGSGTLVCDGKLPDACSTSLQDQTKWTGTVWLKNKTMDNWNFGLYGNAKSSIKLTGITGNGPNNSTDTCASTLILEDVKGDNDVITTYALTIDNGYSTQSYTFSKLAGTGTFRFHRDDTTRPTHQYIFADVSEFDGKIYDIGQLKVVIGSGTGTAGAITFADGVSVKAGLGWEASSVSFGATLKVVDAKFGDVLISSVTTKPATLPGLVDATSDNAILDIAVGYDAENQQIKIVKAGAQTGSGKSYETVEDAINGEGGTEQSPTAITITKDTTVAVEKMTAGNVFKIMPKAETTSKFRWTDATGDDSAKYIVCSGEGVFTVKAGTPANGMPSFDSYMLGLDTENPTAKPFLKSVQDGEADTVTFNFGGINVRTGTGFTVKYAVEYSDSLDFGGTPDETDRTSSASVSVDLPTAGTKVRYYRPKFIFE